MIYLCNFSVRNRVVEPDKLPTKLNTLFLFSVDKTIIVVYTILMNWNALLFDWQTTP